MRGEGSRPFAVQNVHIRSCHSATRTRHSDRGIDRALATEQTQQHDIYDRNERFGVESKKTTPAQVLTGIDIGLQIRRHTFAGAVYNVVMISLHERQKLVVIVNLDLQEMMNMTSGLLMT